MFSEEYILLHRDQRNPWHLDKRTVVMVSVLIIPVTLFCATYMILFGIYEKLIYPRPLLNNLNSILKDQYRATAYSRNVFSENTTNTELSANHIRPIELSSSDLKLICYYNFPDGKDSMKIHQIDPNLCTHINVAFGSVVNHSVYLSDENLEYLMNVVAFKQENPNLKVLLSVGGYGNQDGFPDMVLNHTNRKTFIKSVLSFVKNYKIDGIDLDWEFPGPNVKEKMHFTQLLAEMRKTIYKQETYKFLLTVAVAAPTEIVDVSYDISYMNEYVDFVNLMSYDYHYYTSLTPFTGLNSPLYVSSNEKYYLSTLNINYSSHYWNQLGMDKSKIVVGLPTYGHSFRLLNARNHDLYAPASGYGKLGNLGFATFPMICNFLQTNHITPIFDMENYSPYATKYYEWISFDDPNSLTYKAEFIKNNNFGGAMVYCLNADDFKGECKMGGVESKKFPLTSAVKSVLFNN